MDSVFPDLEAVRPAVSRHTRVTPLLHSSWLSAETGSDVFLKCENLQVTGSFKIRGALAALDRMDKSIRGAGVVTCSAGNHGIGLARAAALYQIPCTVVVSSAVPKVKAEGIEGEGARVVRSPFPGYDKSLDWAMERLAEWGGTYVSPFDHPAVMAGNGGTTLLEMLEQVPDLDTLVVPCGGGGMSVGMGWAARETGRKVRVIGVNTDASPGMWLSRRDGRAHLRLQSAPTIAEGIEGGVSERTYRLGLTYIDDVVVVAEKKIRSAVRQLAERERQIVEGSGAAGVAAVLDGLVPGAKLGVVLTGSNIDLDLLRALLAEKSPG